MTRPLDEVTDEQREHCALSTMRMAVAEYARQKGLSFEEAFLLFSRSPVYRMLFDFETALWKEGPHYVLALFEKSTTRSPR